MTTIVAGDPHPHSLNAKVLVGNMHLSIPRPISCICQIAGEWQPIHR